MKPILDHTGASYDGIARKYAETVDTKPIIAYYERPALLSLLPPMKNATVLDVGCGSGWYSEYLLNCGAAVTAFDANIDFVKLTQLRTAGRARVLQADLAAPLNFATNEEFDVIVCPLVMHYLKDWQPVFREFGRILKPHGRLIFSTHHPFMDWKLFNTEDYFAIDLLEDEWKVGKVRFYRRPLTTISQNLDSAGFMIERLLEPQPTEDFQKVRPKKFEQLTKNPQFLIIRARKHA